MSKLDINRIFSDAMERGGPKAADDVAEKRKSVHTAFDEYLDSVERHYFEWGFKECLSILGK